MAASSPDVMFLSSVMSWSRNTADNCAFRCVLAELMRSLVARLACAFF